MNFGVVVTFFLLLLLVILQSTLFGYLPIGGVIVQVAVTVVWAAALWRGSSDTLALAFVCGLLIDLGSIAPFGSSAIALTVGVVVIGQLRASLIYSRFVMPLLLAGLAQLTFLLVSVAIYRLFGYAVSANYLAQLPTMVIVYALITVLLYWLLQLFDNSRRKRVGEINM